MKKLIAFIIIIGLMIFINCEINQPDAPVLNISQNQLVLSKIVCIGNSLTAGFQSAGLVKDFQENSFPYQIAKQMGKTEFQQPLIDDPGISSTPGVGVLDFDPATGAIEPRGTYTDPTALLLNATLRRPYDNLGIPGAKLNESLNAYNSQLADGNSFFDIILRNLPDPNFANMNQIQQATVLGPTLVIVWIGNNDVLGAALDGGDLTQLTDPAVFQSDYTSLITQLGKIRDGKVGIILANIPNVTDIPYINILDDIFQTIPLLGINSPVPVLFQTQQNAQGGIDFAPIDFGGFFLPLNTAEFLSGVTHVLLPTLSEYQSSGLGVPDSAIIATTLITQAGFDTATAAGTAQQLVAGMIQAGLTPSGVQVPGNLTITAAEEVAIASAVSGFNQIITGIAGQAGIPLVDVNQLLNDMNTNGIDGYTGKFVLSDPANTAFSLDGVHPNNGGYAIVANAFIEKTNQILNLQIPLINTAQFKGQYLGKPVTMISKEAANLVKPLFVKKKQ